jgi:hypothetical protein
MCQAVVCLALSKGTHGFLGESPCAAEPKDFSIGC